MSSAFSLPSTAIVLAVMRLAVQARPNRKVDWSQGGAADHTPTQIDVRCTSCRLPSYACTCPSSL
jgi:hypothetical protein